jgi:uncharacterized protein (DUF1330 family)
LIDADIEARHATEGRLHMAKGYWIARVDVKNEEGYKPYAAANPAIFKKFGGGFWYAAAKSTLRKAIAAPATL